MSGKTSQHLLRADLQVGKRDAEWNQRIGRDAFHQVEEDIVKKTDLSLFEPILACNEQRSGLLEDEEAAFGRAGRDRILQLDDNIRRRNRAHGGPGKL
ncbi:hypothetical protein [Bradyrhizobium liaoningense]|uniref:hypothetical protein n=1 Tax=Bradyrhizobium liaoningense TaxID=43992 RepID=UPI0028A151B3|nr:hypothetical protein [Bradyrhizobium liaoningense]